jgi:hypothetical protein
VRLLRVRDDSGRETVKEGAPVHWGRYQRYD